MFRVDRISKCRRVPAKNSVRALSSSQAVIKRIDHGITNKKLEDNQLYIGPTEILATGMKDTPWKTLLEYSARASWRVSNGRPSEAFQKSMKAVTDLSNRSNREIQTVFEKIVESHTELKNRRERERSRLVNNREYKKKEMNRDNQILSVLYGPEETIAACKYRLFPNYSVAKRVLEECRSLVGPNSWSPTNVLDFGIGVGSASAAAMDTWESVEWIHGIDSSATMREGAKLFLETYGKERDLDARVTFAAHLSAASPPTFDLVLFANTATEIPQGSAMLAAAALSWEKLRPGGIFVMIEPGTPDGFSSVRTVRNMLLDCASPEEEDELGNGACFVIAPCTHNGPCPMERFENRALRRMMKQQKTQVNAEDYVDESTEDKLDERREQDKWEEDDKEEIDDEDHMADGIRRGFCSFVQTMPGSRGSLTGEKFSYLVAQKRVPNASEAPGLLEHVNLVNELRKDLLVYPGNKDIIEGNVARAKELEDIFLASDEDALGLEFLRGDANRSSFGRIVRQPMKKRGHILIDYCTRSRGIVRKTVRKSHAKVAPGFYAAARKSRWGGLWPDIEDENDKN
jgi:ribosomal protein RSM22 (predicted rRNA methylase)